MNLEEYITKKYLDKGKNSKCFVLKSGNVFKQFNEPLDAKYVDKFKYFLNYENENFLFPFEFICDGKKFYGYVTKRAIGEKVKDTFSKINLETLSESSKKLENNIDYISEGKIIMIDAHAGNIMYDDKTLQIIDPDYYKISTECDVADIKKQNRNYYKYEISQLFLLNLRSNNYKKYILDKINKYNYSDICASEVILKLKEDMEQYCKETINTVQEFNKIVRK